MRLAEIVPDEAALQPKGLAVFRRFLGSRVQAAQECRDDTCVTAVGGSPAERVRQAEALAEAKKESLTDSPRFQMSIASLPEKPNLLLYVSPDALRRWFTLAGRIASEPIPADALGLSAGLTIDGEGARFVFKFPTAASRPLKKTFPRRRRVALSSPGVAIPGSVPPRVGSAHTSPPGCGVPRFRIFNTREDFSNTRAARRLLYVAAVARWVAPFRRGFTKSFSRKML